jgi:NADPH:quinone reductase
MLHAWAGTIRCDSQYPGASRLTIETIMDEPESMQAAVLDAHGSEFRHTTVPRPVAGHGQVLVRIEASGVNPLDLKIRTGNAPHAKHPLPAILGLDMAGTVTAVGSGVTGFSPGDEVFGLTGGVGGLQGSLAEFAAVDAALLAAKPTNISMREAAAIPLTFITAWEGLVDRAQLQARQKVLIQGAGGVGLMAIQIALACGARTFAADRPAKQALIENLGATAIDSQHSNVEEYVSDHTRGQGFDVVYDTVGGATLDASFHAVRRFGHVASCLGWGTHSLAPLSFRAATYSGVFTLLPMLTGEGREHHGEILREAKRLVEAGQLMPRIDPRHFTLASVEDAHHIVTNRTAAGKVVIDLVH